MSEEKQQEAVETLSAKYRNLEKVCDVMPDEQPPVLDSAKIEQPLAEMVRDWFAQRDLMIEALQQRKKELLKELEETNKYLIELGVKEVSEEEFENDPTLGSKKDDGERDYSYYEDETKKKKQRQRMKDLVDEDLVDPPQGKKVRKKSPLKAAQRFKVLQLLKGAEKALVIDDFVRKLHMAKFVVVAHLKGLKEEGLVTQTNKYWRLA